MTTYSHSTNDPLGYRQDLLDAIAAIETASGPYQGTHAVDVLFCLGRCLLYGQAPEGDVAKRVDREVLQAALSDVEVEVLGWITAIEDLPQAWDVTWQDDEAALLCQSLLESQLDARAAELAVAQLQLNVPQSLAESLRQFDMSLRQQREILATVVGSTWWENLRSTLPLSESFWWLSDEFSQVAVMVVREASQSLPTADDWTTIRSRALWQEAMPRFTGALAAKTESDAPDFTRVRWHSPDRKFTAFLMLPRDSNRSDREIPRTLYIARANDESLATEFAGQAFTLGDLTGLFDEQGCVKVRLDDIADCDGQLKIGTPSVAWRIELDPPLARSGESM